MTELILGAAIALVSSIITSYIVHLFEIKRSVQSRKWQLEDFKNSELLEVTRKRIDAIEVALDQLREVIVKAKDIEIELIESSKEVSQKEALSIFSFEKQSNISEILSSFKKDYPDEFEKLVNKFEALSTQAESIMAKTQSSEDEILRLLPYIASLGNVMLLQKVNELLSLAGDEESQLLRITQLIAKGEEFDNDEEIRRIFRFETTAYKIHGQIIEQLDLMRVNKLS